jgi:hypothetical protein
VWVGSTTTDANGNWSVSIASAGCAAAPISVQAQAIGATQAAADAVQAFATARTSTTITGAVIQPITLLALGLTSRKASVGVTVLIDAVCQ